MPAGAEYILPVELAHAVSCPHGGGLMKVMEQAGAGLIFTILEQLELQPLPSVTVVE